MLYLFKKTSTIPQLWQLCNRKVEPLARILRPEMDESLIDGVYEALHKLPMLTVQMSLAVGENPPSSISKNSSSRFHDVFFFDHM